MLRNTIRTLLLTVAGLFTLFYLAGVVIVATDDSRVEAFTATASTPRDIAIFGASGTAGDGILKAALADPQVRKIHVITRRATPRIDQGVATGKVEMTQHLNYLDYSDLREQITGVDTVYWAIGISSLGADEATYRRIHVDFPLAFVRAWVAASDEPDLSFHFISSSDIAEGSSTMWVREKIRAEQSLFAFAEGTPLRVVAYRPDYIGPTREEAHLGQNLVYGFFRPVGAAVRATEIGRAMLELTARGDRIRNGTKVGTRSIVRYSQAYDARRKK